MIIYVGKKCVLSGGDYGPNANGKHIFFRALSNYNEVLDTPWNPIFAIFSWLNINIFLGESQKSKIQTLCAIYAHTYA